MNIKEIKHWFELAIPEPTVEQACIQLGCHYEECAEMSEALGDFSASEMLQDAGKLYKELGPSFLRAIKSLDDRSKVELLDSLCDQIVTAIGVAHMLGMDIEGALSNVNASNFSKFEDGKPVFNDQGKISKGRYYIAPDLRQFIGE